MKKVIVLHAVIFFAVATRAQPTSQSLPGATTNTTGKASYSIVDKGANYRVWQRADSGTNSSASPSQKPHQYVELQTGMHYLNDGQWLQADPTIEITPQGGVGNRTAHSVVFAPDINTAGALDLTSADGKRFRTRILGIGYFDYSTGKSTLIADLKSSEGQLLPSNTEILYPAKAAAKANKAKVSRSRRRSEM